MAETIFQGARTTGNNNKLVIIYNIINISHNMQHFQVKEYIKRAKAWRNNKWMNNSHGKPKSYLISLLVVGAYERAHSADAKRCVLCMYNQQVSFELMMQGYIGPERVGEE